MKLQMKPHPILIRASIALVWLYQGLWCKLLSGVPRHEAVVGAVPFIGPGAARSVLMGVGLAECCIAVWVLSGKRMRDAAITQTVLLTGMNTAGLIWARQFIPDPGNMIVQNFAFLVLIWVSAEVPTYAAQN